MAAARSIVAAGSLIAGSVERSVLFPECEVGDGSTIEGSLVLPNAAIGRNCRLRNVVVDGGCEIPDGTVIGFDPRADAANYDVSPGGVVLVTATRVPRQAVLNPEDMRKAAA